MARNIKFEFFRVSAMEIDNIDSKVDFNIESLFEKVSKITDVSIKTFPYHYERARIHKCEFLNGFWCVQFLRIRDNNLPPTYTDDEGNFDYIVLDQGKYMAEPVSVIYNPSDNIIVLQRYIYGLPPSGIEQYLTSAWGTRARRIICLEPIQANRRIKEITPKTIFKNTKFSIDIPENLEKEATQSHSLNELLNKYKNMDASRVNVVIYAKRSKDGHLDSISISELIYGLYKNEYTRKLQVKYTNDNIHVESVDLLQDKLSDNIKLNVTKDNPLQHERLIPEMINSYHRMSKIYSFKR